MRKESQETKSLRWLANMFPFTENPEDEGDKMCNAIHVYAKAGADKINELQETIDELKELMKDEPLKKIEMFFEWSKRGFVLISGNNKRELTKIRKICENKIHPKFYDMQSTEYREILADIKTKTAKSAVFENFAMSDEKLKDLLERFNLGRDLLLDNMQYCIFIVPPYVDLYIQEFLPNLDSYFELRLQISDSNIKR